jgi:hypothetical protein
MVFIIEDETGFRVEEKRLIQICGPDVMLEKDLEYKRGEGAGGQTSNCCGPTRAKDIV